MITASRRGPKELSENPRPRDSKDMITRSLLSLLQICGEQLQGAGPGVFCFGGAIDVGAGVVEEAVRASWIDFDFALLVVLF
jgi:hypothetical protein